MSSKKPTTIDDKIAELEGKVERTEARLERYRTDLGALRRARDILSEEASGMGRGAVVKAIRDILTRLPDTFNSKIVMGRLAQEYPGRKWDRTSIATALRRLAEDKVLVQIVKSSGRTPGQFRIADQGGT
jgi:hypothetical protein